MAFRHNKLQPLHFLPTYQTRKVGETRPIEQRVTCVAETQIGEPRKRSGQILLMGCERVWNVLTWPNACPLARWPWLSGAWYVPFSRSHQQVVFCFALCMKVRLRG